MLINHKRKKMKHLLTMVIILFFGILTYNCSRNKVTIEEAYFKSELQDQKSQDIYRADGGHTFLIVKLELKTGDFATADFSIHTRNGSVYKAVGYLLGNSVMMGNLSQTGESGKYVRNVIFCIPNIEKQNILGLQFKDNQLISVSIQNK